MSKLDGQGTDKEAVAQQLAAVQQQVEQVKGENEELRNFFQEALHVSSTSDAWDIAEHWRADRVWQAADQVLSSSYFGIQVSTHLAIFRCLSSTHLPLS